MSLHLTTTLSASQRLEFSVQGDFFRLMQAAQPLMVQFYRNGAEIAEAVDVAAGYAERFRTQKFDRIAITNGAISQSVQIAARDGNDVAYDTPPNGNVQITNNGGLFSQTTHTVTTTSSQLKAQATLRRYLLIQNRNATGIIYVMVNGLTATVADGIEIGPGGSLEFNTFVPIAAITAIGSIASNTNVIVLEG